MEDAKIDFTPVVNALKANMHKDGTVLILGSRAGSFFRSQDFYNRMKSFGNASFEQQPRVKQFAESYKLLTALPWDEIDDVFIKSLHNVESRNADKCLAKLVKQGVFDIIISTNIDNLLEQVLEEEGMRELHDFDIFSLKSDVTIRSKKHFSLRIIKVLGELRTRIYAYTMMSNARLHSTQKIEEILKTELARNILAIGLDPVWDAAILNAIPSEGKPFWYISDDMSDTYPVLHEISKTRFCQLLVGINGSYSNIMEELSKFLLEKPSSDAIQLERMQADARLIENRKANENIYSLVSTSVISPPEQSPLTARTSLEVFISYTLEDKSLCDQLVTHLRALGNQKLISTWHRRIIIKSDHQKNYIDGNLNRASIILLLVSANFIALDDYIHGVELEHALEMHRGGKARVVPVMLRPAGCQGTPFEALMPLPTNGRPVIKWADRDSAFLDIVEGIKKVIDDLWQNKL